MNAKDAINKLNLNDEVFLPENHYDIGIINSNDNGYPDSSVLSGTYDSVLLGFNEYNEASQFANSIESEVVLVSRKAGQDFYKLLNGHFGRPLSIYDYITDLGDNYELFDYDDYLEGLEENIRLAEDLDEIKALIDTFTNLHEIYKKLNTEEVIITCCGNYYDTVKKELMEYREDITTYAVGVLIKHEVIN